jgi:hypothetical protein
MTQTPPPMPNSPYGNEGYSGGMPQVTSGKAKAAMILGIISIGCPGLIFSVLAIIFGIIAINEINRDVRLGGKGQAMAGIVTGAVSLVLLPVMALMIAILLPSLGKAREMANRTTCGANQMGIMRAMLIYANDNNDRYPIVAARGGYGLAAAGSGTPGATWDDTVKSMYKGAPSPSVTQNMWLLVGSGMVAPRQFTCKSDLAVNTPASLLVNGNYAINFNDGRGPSDMTYSYSWAYMWRADGAVGGWWGNTMNAGLPIMADMAPLDGSGSPAAVAANGRSREGNSFNHNRDGQNVAFGDAHVEFVRYAAAGVTGDNIYTGNGGRPGEGGRQTAGREPDIGMGGTMGTFDVCLVPAADGNAGYGRK